MKEGKDGVWEYTTTEPLKPELYGYSFYVDGLKNNGSRQRLYDSRRGNCDFVFGNWRGTHLEKLAHLSDGVRAEVIQVTSCRLIHPALCQSEVQDYRKPV